MFNEREREFKSEIRSYCWETEKKTKKNFTLCTQGINTDSFVLLYLGKIHIYTAHNEVCTF